MPTSRQSRPERPARPLGDLRPPGCPSASSTAASVRAERDLGGRRVWHPPARPAREYNGRGAAFRSRSTHPNASWAIVRPACSATGRRRCTASSTRGSTSQPMKSLMLSLAARESRGGGSPGRYLPVRTPWASGDQTICEMPFALAERDHLALGLAPEERVLRLARDPPGRFPAARARLRSCQPAIR